MNPAPSLRILLAAIALSQPAPAWNATGHRVIAAIAYDRLTPSAKLRADELIRRHPDYASFTAGAPEDPAARARSAFIAASVWADHIRNDTRFYDESRAAAVPTRVLAGFPSMARRTNWHQIDIPFTTDGTPLLPALTPNALTEIPRLLDEIAGAYPSYSLVWLVHLIGDIHEPLHCASRFVASQPNGDAGGNFVFVRTSTGHSARTLHSFWDGLAGTDTRPAYVNRLAREIAGESAETLGDPQARVEEWVKEGNALARQQVYQFGNETGTREVPLVFPKGYTEEARFLARIQIARAGDRLAAALNYFLR